MTQTEDGTEQPKAKGKQEQREFQRISMSVPIEVAILAYPLPKKTSTGSRIINIGDGGIAFVSKVAYIPGTPLSLKVHLRGWESYRTPFSMLVDLSAEEPFAAIAEVTWCRPSSPGKGYDVGVRFLNVDEADYKALMGYLEDHGSPGTKGRHR